MEERCLKRRSQQGVDFLLFVGIFADQFVVKRLVRLALLAERGQIPPRDLPVRFVVHIVADRRLQQVGGAGVIAADKSDLAQSESDAGRHAERSSLHLPFGERREPFGPIDHLIIYFVDAMPISVGRFPVILQTGPIAQFHIQSGGPVVDRNVPRVEGQSFFDQRERFFQLAFLHIKGVRFLEN